MLFRLLILAICLLVSAVPAASETLDRCFTLLDDDTHSASTTGSIVEMRAYDPKQLAGVLTGTNSSGSTPTMDVVIQSCRTLFGPCNNRMVFTQCTTGACNTSGLETYDLSPGDNWFRFWRAKTTLGGTSPVYDVKVEVCY